MSTAFEIYVGIIGAGYGPGFETDAADLMTLRLITLDNTAEVITGSALANLGVDPRVRDAFAELDTAPAGGYQDLVADLAVAKKIDEISGADDVAAPLAITGAFDDDDDESSDESSDENKKLSITNTFADNKSSVTSDNLNIAGAFADDISSIDSNTTYQVFDGGANKPTSAMAVAAASTVEPFEEAAAAGLIAIASDETAAEAMVGMNELVPVAAASLGAGSDSDVSALVEKPERYDNIFTEELSIAGAFGDV